jgi:hypothetical protein
MSPIILIVLAVILVVVSLVFVAKRPGAHNIGKYSGGVLVFIGLSIIIYGFVSNDPWGGITNSIVGALFMVPGIIIFLISYFRPKT